MMRTLKTSALLLIIASTVTIHSCQEANRPMEQRTAKGNAHVGGTLTVAISQNPSTMMPDQISDAVSSEIGLHLHSGLLRLDASTLDAVPDLAESWSVDEAGTSYVFTIRKGAQFHDDKCFGNSSRAITAKDFAYSFQRLCSPNEGTAFETTFRNRVKGADAFRAGETTELTGVTAIDDYTLRIDLIKPDPSFLFVLAQPAAGVIPEKAVAKYGSASTVGAGPFQFGNKENDLLLIRNRDFHLQDAFGNRLPYIDTLVFRTVASKEQQLSLFFEGGLDVVSGLYLDPVKQILEEHVADFSGKEPTYVMQRESESVGYESYSIFRTEVKDLGNNFMGFRDFSNVQIEQ